MSFSTRAAPVAVMLSLLSISGCAKRAASDPAARAAAGGPAPVAHFVPAPPLPPAPPPPDVNADEHIGFGGGMGGGDTIYAQTFTVTADGTLSEIQFGPQVQSYGQRDKEAKPDLTVELWPTGPTGEPVLDGSTAMLRATIPGAAMPQAGSEGKLTRLDVSGFG